MNQEVAIKWWNSAHMSQLQIVSNEVLSPIFPQARAAAVCVPLQKSQLHS